MLLNKQLQQYYYYLSHHIQYHDYKLKEWYKSYDELDCIKISKPIIKTYSGLFRSREFLEYELVTTVRYNSDEQLCKDLYDFVRLHIKDDIMSYEEWIK